MEKVPKETETIAHKKAIRLSEKLQAARARMGLQKAWWTGASIEFFGLTILFAINLVLIFPLFGQPAESTSFSGPVIPLIAKLITFLGVPFMYAVQLTNIIFFLGFPLSFYFFVKAVSGRKFSAFLSTLVAMLPFYLFAKTRVQFGLLGDESPYIASLTVIPIALVPLLNFLRTGGVKNLIVSCFIAALVALISPFGIFIYAITSVVTTFSEMLLGDGRLKILRLLTVFFFGATLCSFWYNPVFFYWMVTGPMGEEIRQMIRKLIPISLFAIPVLTSFGYLLFDRKPNLQPFFLSLFYTLVFLIVVMAGGGFVPSNPGRYIPVLGISISFFFGVSVLNLFEYLKNRFPNLFFVTGLKDLSLVAFSGLVAASIVFWKDSIFDQSNSVLGIWTDVQKGDIWTAADRFSGQYAILGDAITLIGIGALAYMYFKYKSQLPESSLADNFQS